MDQANGLTGKKALITGVPRTPVFLCSALEIGGVSGKYFESSSRPKQLPVEILEPALQEKTWELAKRLVSNAPTAIPVSGMERLSFAGLYRKVEIC
jgi:hypothetical protein